MLLLAAQDLRDRIQPESTNTSVASDKSLERRGVGELSAAEVSFQWKNPDSLFRNPDFLLGACVLTQPLLRCGLLLSSLQRHSAAPSAHRGA